MEIDKEEKAKRRFFMIFFIKRWYKKLFSLLYDINLRYILWPNYRKYKFTLNVFALAIEDEELQK